MCARLLWRLPVPPHPRPMRCPVPPYANSVLRAYARARYCGTVASPVLWDCVGTDVRGCAVLPATIADVTIVLINDAVPFLLGCTQGSEWLWEHLHSELAADAGADSPVLRLRASMADVLQQATQDKSDAMELDGGGGGGGASEREKERELLLLGVPDAGGLVCAYAPPTRSPVLT